MKNLILIVCCFITIKTISQEKKEFTILNNSKKWNREIIKFPIDWVPEIDLVGFEELLFSPKWKDSKSDQFWSLVMTWKSEATSKLSKKKITFYFKSYFEGLMKPNHWAKEFPSPKVTFRKSSKNKLKGKMTFFDGFHTGKVITVNMEVTQHFSKKKNTTIIIFRISPKKRNHKIWKILNDIKL